MEPTNNTVNGGQNKTASGILPTNPASGLDLDHLLGNLELPESIKHLISGGGALAAAYFILIKPMQDKLDAMNLRIIEQEHRIDDLEEEQEELTDELNRIQKEVTQSLNATSEDHFAIRTRIPLPGAVKKQRGGRL